MSPLPLDTEALRIVRYSAGQLTHLADEFVAWLHGEIVALSPEVASSVADEGWPFCQRMAQAMLWVALTDQPTGVVTGVLRRVGEDNWNDGFPEGEYVSVAHALVRALRDLSGAEWFTAMASAWISCFQWMQPHLLAGARQAAASGPMPGPVPGPAFVPSENEQQVSAAEAAEPDLESAPDLMDDDDEEDDVGYGSLMMSMTLNSRRHPDG
ncbi:MAG TPA: hypothetical protein VMA95_05145 [Streptosporangiaceae bacterium]|nr:hypothetical protein [Streptosporangiaceae bacterium]